MVELIAIRKFPAPMIASRRSQHFQTTGGATWSLDGVIRHHHDFFAAQDDEHIITVRSPLFGSVTQISLNRRPNTLSIGWVPPGTSMNTPPSGSAMPILGTPMA